MREDLGICLLSLPLFVLMFISPDHPNCINASLFLHLALEQNHLSSKTIVRCGSRNYLMRRPYQISTVVETIPRSFCPSLLYSLLSFMIHKLPCHIHEHATYLSLGIIISAIFLGHFSHKINYFEPLNL